MANRLPNSPFHGRRHRQGPGRCPRRCRCLGATSAQARSLVLLKIADRIEQNLELLAITESWDNGKAVRETLNADIPLAADHFRYFAGCIRAQEGSAAEIDGKHRGLSHP